MIINVYLKDFPFIINIVNIIAQEFLQADIYDRTTPDKAGSKRTSLANNSLN
jgi:hypothetical protein